MLAPNDDQFEASFTNSSQDAVMVQLFPWGWQLQPNRDVMLRDHYYRGMAIAANAAYFSWVNPDAEKAFLKRYYHCQQPFLNE